MFSGPKRTIRRARQLRGEMSLPEVVLWRALRTRPDGLKFRRQQAAGPYVIDFYCHESALAIEVDGDAHNRGDRPQHDAIRDAYLRSNGCRVMRVAAIDVLSDLDSVVRQIVALARESPLHHPSDGPPPLEGRI